MEAGLDAKIQEFHSHLCMEIKTVLENPLNSCSKSICNLMQEFETYIDVKKEECGIGYDKMTGRGEVYRLSNKEEKNYIKSKTSYFCIC